MEKGQVWRQHAVGGIASIAVAAVGYCMGWTSPVNVILVDQDLTPLPAPATEDQIAWIGSLLSIGAIIGPFLGGILSSTIGRKWCLLSSSIPVLVGWILMLVGTSVTLMYVARVLWGLAMGMIFAISPIYCIEIATVDARGALGSFLQTFITLGTLLVYAVGPLSYNSIAYTGLALGVVFAVTFVFMPESPTYYLMKGDRAAAADALAKIRGKSHKGVEKELSLMADDVDSSKDKTGKFADLFRGKNFKAFYIVCVLMYFGQMAGISPVIFYVTAIFDAADSDLDPAYSAIIFGAVQFVAALMTQFIADRMGRRILMMISSCGSAVGLGLLGLYFLLADLNSPIVESIHFLPLFSLGLYIVMYCWGLGGLPWAIMGELLPNEVKALGAPIATAFFWTISFVVTKYFYQVADSVGMYVVFWFFAANCVGCFFFSLLVLPETKDKTYNEIQDSLGGGTKIQVIA